MGSIQEPGKELDFKRYKAFIFDFDGTLYDASNSALNLIMSRPQDLFRLRSERAARRLLCGKWFGNAASYDKEHASLMYRGKGFSSPGEALAWYKGVCIDNMIKVLSKKYRARPGAAGLFSLLKENGVKTCVVSDYIRTAERLSAIGLEGCADFTVNSEELGGLKPALEVFAALSDILGCARGELLMVGDRNDTDGEGALKSGMDFVRIETGKNRKVRPLSGSLAAVTWEVFAALVEKSFPSSRSGQRSP